MYLQERTQRIVIDGQSSSTTTLTAGVPQGSVLEPLLFSLYVQPIGDIIRAHGLFFHHDADYLHIYPHFDPNPSALPAVVQQIEDCLVDIKQWMAWNYMCMNDSKTQYLPIAPKSVATLVDGNVIRVCVSTITASRCVRNIGVFIDRHLYMQASFSNRQCIFILPPTHQSNQPFLLPKPTKERVGLTAAMHGTSVVNIGRLQRIHHSASRVILRRPRSDSARPLLQQHHWLPVAPRVDFKILVLTYKSMHDEAPVYLCELLRPYQPARALNSASSNNLEVKRTRTKAGSGSFVIYYY